MFLPKKIEIYDYETAHVSEMPVSGSISETWAAYLEKYHKYRDAI